MLYEGGAVKPYKGHGVWVKDGYQASWIMEGAWALEREFDVPPFISRSMCQAVLDALVKHGVRLENSSTQEEGT
jgi:hypothetical protein